MQYGRRTECSCAKQLFHVTKFLSAEESASELAAYDEVVNGKHMSDVASISHAASEVTRSRNKHAFALNDTDDM